MAGNTMLKPVFKLKNFWLLVSLFAVMTHFSCNRYDFSGEINTVDSLLTKSGGFRLFLDTTDWEEVKRKLLIVEKDITFVKDSMPPEMLGEAAPLLSDMKVIKKYMANTDITKAALLKETDYSVNQLTNLKTDLQNNSLKPEDARKYIRDESKALSAIEDRIGKLKVGLKLLNGTYFRLRKDFYAKYRQHLESNPQ